MLKEIDVVVVECIVVNELCEWNTYKCENLKDIDIRVTPLIRTESVDTVVPKCSSFFCCKIER